MHFTFTQLEYIVAVDTHRHFVTAAERCHVTQPTLSMQIKKLEEQLGVVLFDRTRQPVVPTDAGRAIIAQARNILREVEKIEEIIQEVKSVLSGELRLGIIPTLAPYLLPRFVGTFTRAYPQVHLQVRELLTEDIVAQLRTDQLDAGLAVTPLQEPSILERPLFYEDLLLYVHPDHPLAQQPGIEAHEVPQEDLWLLAEGHCFRNQTLNLCGHTGAGAEMFSYESGSLETLRKMVDTEGGSTLLPELAALEVPERQRYRLKEITPRPVREVSLIYSRNFAKERLLTRLTEIIRQAVPADLLDEARGTVVRVR
ncbi:LysR family transcriptional regulator, hydrogen peroxide-inducible genes activator [Catalinimonas alkaloidigena]|uniref:LysR family transcriptional regulator, hydrogen peroxide-inducible genes activator n=1 Tax=Catalinimonas alkaloidigena TaxID=1075417 RepID=A0A1G9D897_9BACT|nr:hydrogen peroxide-inducible genes activator [Catalinimonas alkaloidigena]SDK60081.1 LysR family transcriptional regulator, hydrogen peroxide-inducible genes activator [Catalinimonas alkaloidigena]